MIPNVIITGIAGLASGFVVGLLGIAKNRLKEKKQNINFDYEKFSWTLISYALGGLVVGVFSENYMLAIVAGLAVDKSVKIGLALKESV